MNEKLKIRLVSMKNTDLEVRNRILKEGGLYDGYAEEMESLHIRNAEELKRIIDEYGWPGKLLVVQEGGGPPSDIREHKIKGQKWAKRVGWQ